MNRLRRAYLISLTQGNPDPRFLLGARQEMARRSAGSSMMPYSPSPPGTDISATEKASVSKSKLNFDPKAIKEALHIMQKILTKDISPPEGGGWEVLSKPTQQEGFEKTYLVEFNLDRYATMKSDHHNNNRFVKELASLMGVNRKIIFLLPHLHTISPNVLLCLKDLDFAMRANYGELLICTSDYGSYSMLHNERLNVHSELDDALETLRFEKSMEASRGDKVYFPSSGVNYVGP